MTHLTNQSCLLVFYISIRNIDFSSKLTSFQLLVKELLPDWNIDTNTADALIKLINELCGVYILIDGLDEAENRFFSSPSKTISLFETTTADNIIKHIFEKRFLKMIKNLLHRGQMLFIQNVNQLSRWKF